MIVCGAVKAADGWSIVTTRVTLFVTWRSSVTVNRTV